LKWNNKGYQFDEIGKLFEQRKRIMIYGAGEQGIYLLEKLNFLNCVDGFIDQDTEKQRTGICGLPVLEPDAVLNKRDKVHLIIIGTNQHNAAEIKKALVLAGYSEGSDFWSCEDEKTTAVFALYAYGKVYLSSSCLIPSTVCNLNCEKCLNFTPALNTFKRHVTKSVEQLREEVDLLFHWVDFIPRFQISGGEPLLYPYFCEIVEYVGANYRDKIGDRFETVLNGSVIPTDQQCLVMKKYDVLAIVDDYTENVPICSRNRKKIIEQLVRFNIRMEDNFVPEWFDLDIEHMDNSQLSGEEMAAYFDNCGNPWNYFEKGKLYACNFNSFAIKAGLIAETPDDYFDLNAEITPSRKKELVEFILGYNNRGYAGLCRHCAGWAKSNPKCVPVAVQVGENI
jgi:organic radical activating enzyme